MAGKTGMGIGTAVNFPHMGTPSPLMQAIDVLGIDTIDQTTILHFRQYRMHDRGLEGIEMVEEFPCPSIEFRGIVKEYLQ